MFTKFKAMSLAAPLLVAMAGGSMAATELDNLDAAEREAFRAEVRAYLLENPDVLLEAFGILEERQAVAEREAGARAVADNADALFNSAFDYVGGNPDGDIVLVEFLDYQCSFCRRANPDVDALLASDGNIRLVVKELPILGEESVLASRFAIATRIAHGDAAYHAMHDALMQMRGAISEPSLAAMAERNDLDPEPILAAMTDPLVENTILYNRRLAERLGISGTPSFVFDDQLVRGYVPYDAMIQIVADLRAQAR